MARNIRRDGTGASLDGTRFNEPVSRVKRDAREISAIRDSRATIARRSRERVLTSERREAQRTEM